MNSSSAVTAQRMVNVKYNRHDAMNDTNYDTHTVYSSFWQNINFECLPSVKGIYSKMKDFVPRGSKVFPFRTDPFHKGPV